MATDIGKPWRCAVVGTGLVGEWHVRTLPRIPGAQLIAVCDKDPAKAEAVLQKNALTNIPIYDNLPTLLREQQVDVIHLCTPSGEHLDSALLAMQAGKHVICEKPLEITLDRVDRMLDAAQKHNVRLAGIFQNRWNLANRALKDAAASGRFGRLAWAGCFTPWYRPDQYYRDGGWRGTWKYDGGGAIMNQSVHAIDLLQWIAGPVKRVSAYAASRIHAEIEVEDTLSASLQFESGAFGTIMGTTAMFPGMPARIEIGGEHGTAISENGLKVFKFRNEQPQDDELRKTLSPNSGSTGGGASAADVKIEMHQKNIEHILQAWRDGHDAETSGPEARKAIAIVLALYESARRNGEPVDILDLPT